MATLVVCIFNGSSASLYPPSSLDVHILGFYHAHYLHRLNSYKTIKLEARHQHVNISVFLWREEEFSVRLLDIG